MVKRGEIYYIDWSPGRGSEQSGIRPALIVQNDVGNRFSRTTIVAAISTQKRRPYPFHVPISPLESGLPEDSIIKCEQLQTVDQQRLGRLAGSLSLGKILEVNEALNRSLGLRY